MDLGEATIRSLDWAQYRIKTGDASQFGDQLIRLLHSRDATESLEVWRNIENHVVSQDTIYDAAEPTVDSILAALVEERPDHVKAMIIDLLFLLLNGGSVEDPNLSGRCRARAMRGTWLLVREAANGPEWVRDAVLEVLELVDAGTAAALRAWLDS